MTIIQRLLVLTAFFFANMPSGAMSAGMKIIDVIIDQARIVRLQNDAAQIIVGNPVIADVAVQDARLLVITGKSYGTTNLIALNQDGVEIFSAQLAVREEANAKVTLYNGTARRSYHCTPECQRMLSIGDDKSQFEDVAQSVERKIGVVNAVLGGN